MVKGACNFPLKKYDLSICCEIPRPASTSTREDVHGTAQDFSLRVLLKMPESAVPHVYILSLFSLIYGSS